jgi:ABC-type uncharacterized transport system auxiliary subunit
MTWRVVALVLLAAAGGCGRGAAVPSDTYYRLAPVAAVPAAPITDQTLVVDAVDADSLYRDRALLYSEDAANLTLKQYHYHHWQESPPRMLQLQLRDFLRAHGASPTVVTRDPGNDAALHVQSRIERFEHLISGGNVTARVALEFTLVGGAGGQPLLNRAYSIDKPAASADVAAVVAAMDAAVNEVFSRFIADARTTIPPATGK